MTKVRLDQLVAGVASVESREKAQRLIMAGKVSVNGQLATKSGHKYPDDVTIDVAGSQRFVGRGGDKMLAAFDTFPIDVNGLICIDVGASTGGFTDCLLQHGATKVYAVDVGKGQLHWKLRNDARVVVMEGVNARHMIPDVFSDHISFAVVDVSFISLTKILPAVTQALGSDAEIVSLIKPQFEAGREQVRKGGVVRDPAVREEVVNRIRQFGEDELGLVWKGLCESPLKGPAGNVEFLAWWKKSLPADHADNTDGESPKDASV
jgi:23S rRNA (cytidine1920-2'-O)/16S rRNA (cytidine1409-2'-O)-methyltransferase